MDTLCRLCGKVKINSINILDGNNESLKLKIYNLLRIEVHQCDVLPTKVCPSCVAAVQEATVFINCCHDVQKILKEKYESDCQDPKDTELVLKTSSSLVSIPSEVEKNKVNAPNEKHSIIFEVEHSIFVEEPKKLTFVDADELISEITSDPLVSEYSTSDNVNMNSRLLKTSSNILPRNEVEPNIKVISNELPAIPRFEIAGVPYSSNDSMNLEELPLIKTEAIEIDDCFTPDPLEMDETYDSNLKSLQKNIIAEVNEKDVSTLNSVMLEPDQNAFSALPISLDGAVHAEEDRNYSSNSTNFPAESINNLQDIEKKVNRKSTKTLLCVSLTRISGNECPQKSACDRASDTNDEMPEPDTHFTSNETDEEDKITPFSTGPSCISLSRNLTNTLMSVLTSQKSASQKFEDVEKGKQLVDKNAWNNYFMTSSFRRESNISVPRSVNCKVVSEKFKTPARPAVCDDGGTSNEMDPQKLFDYCMQITKQFSLKKYKYVERPRADRCTNKNPITSDVSQNQSETESTNQSCFTGSTDPTTAEDSNPKNCLVSNKRRIFFECKTCRKKFLSKSLYDDHLNMHTGYRPFKCDICSKTYRRRSDLTVHIRVIHARGKFKCSLCDYVATYEGKLKVHLKTSHEKPFCCSVCNYRCGAKKRMEEHIINKHQNVVFNPPEVCELCGGSFKGKLSLRAHQHIVHFPEPQICSACGKQCPNQSVYKNHVTQCGKEKIRYECDMCGQTYSKKAVLKEHMNKHLNIKPYECEICNKQFFLRVRLLTHMAVHRAPTFQCEVCCKSFNRKDNMKSHMRKHFEKEGT